MNETIGQKVAREWHYTWLWAYKDAPQAHDLAKRIDKAVGEIIGDIQWELSMQKEQE